MQEQITLTIPGIIKNTRSGYEVLGTGEMKNPENSIIITNKRIILLTVPMSGSGKSIEGVDITLVQNLFLQKEIKRKLDEIVSTKSIENILSILPNFFINLNEIQKIKINTFWGRGIKITTKSGKKYEYSIRSKEDIIELKRILKNYI